MTHHTNENECKADRSSIVLMHAVAQSIVFLVHASERLEMRASTLTNGKICGWDQFSIHGAIHITGYY